MSVRFEFAADPRAIEDLCDAPEWIRDLALEQIEALIHGTARSTELSDLGGFDLSDCRKVVLDEGATWRLVYQERPAAPGSAHENEIFLLTVRPRDQHQAYNTAAYRLGRQRTLRSPLVHAALSRSPRFATTTRTPDPRAVATRPDAPTLKGSTR
ncbi:hypothetical protein ACWCXK_06035 [Streptomyces sp. NPDC001739]